MIQGTFKLHSPPPTLDKEKILNYPFSLSLESTADVEMNSYLTATDVQMKVVDMRIGG